MKNDQGLEGVRISATALCTVFIVELIVVAYGLFTIKDGESSAIIFGGQLVEFIVVVLGSVVLSTLIMLIGVLVRLTIMRP